jgi:CAAX prenyl protease-like protein
LHAGLAEMGKRTASVWICFRLAGSVLLVPIAEELAFRGYLIRRLTSRDFETLALTPVAVFPALVSSVGFGLLHGRWLAGTIAGLAYAFSLHRRGELSDPIAAHMTTNALIAVAVLGAGAWRLWL